MRSLRSVIILLIIPEKKLNLNQTQKIDQKHNHETDQKIKIICRNNNFPDFFHRGKKNIFLRIEKLAVHEIDSQIYILIRINFFGIADVDLGDFGINIT